MLERMVSQIGTSVVCSLRSVTEVVEGEAQIFWAVCTSVADEVLELCSEVGLYSFPPGIPG